MNEVLNESFSATVFASDYLNKFTGEKIERECRQFLKSGCKTLEVNFRETEFVNSVGISILLGVIDEAADLQADVVFSGVSEHTAELFEMLGLTNHVVVVAR